MKARFFVEKNMKRIVWMSDELIATTNPKDWSTLVSKSEELFRVIGNGNFKHEVVSPNQCIGSLAKQLVNQRFTSIIDLTSNSWLSDSLKEIFPSTPVLRDFHLSRVRQVTDPRLPTSGHIVSIPIPQIRELHKKFDLSHSLVGDDVSFSGSSSETTMRLLGLTPENTSHAFLITNTGELGEIPGAKTRLESLGSKIFTGHTLNTSNGDDGWHIKDFIVHPAIERCLGIVLPIHEFIQRKEEGRFLLNELFKTKSVRNTLFPFALSSEKMKALKDDGRFLPSVNEEVWKEGVHTTNPNLLASPYFLEHTSAESFRNNIELVSELITEIHGLSKDRQAQQESVFELRREIRNSLVSAHPERR